MKKSMLIAGAFLLASTSLMAQKEYKLAKSSGKLVLNNVTNLTVEGYDGKEIVFTSTPKGDHESLFTRNEKKGNDPRAEGLSALNNNGFDNTGIGLNITEKGSETVVSPINSGQNRKLKIRLPNTVTLSINNSGWPFTMSDSNSIILNNLKNEVDVSVQFENCRLTGVTGPLSVKTLSGNVEVVLNDNFKSPISIYSVRGLIDLTVSDRTHADLTMSTMGSGTIYADKSLKLEAKPQKQEAAAVAVTSGSISTDTRTNTITLRGVGINGADTMLASRVAPRIYSYSLPFSGNSSFNGTLNGGGGKIKIQTTGGNIYLRK